LSGGGLSARGVSLARRLARSRPGQRLIEAMREQQPPEAPLDEWLAQYFDERLQRLDRECAESGPDAFALFRDLDDDLWTVLLSRRYERYPNIRALLPDLPDESLQVRWNGAAGLTLLNQGKAFYAKARRRFSTHSTVALSDARVLDFGCGWGRLTRFFARDVSPGSLYGCDPVEEILELSRRLRVPAALARCDFVPERLPFEERFELVFAFSVFTHISEAAHEASLRAIHASLDPGGILIVTIRSPAYLSYSESMRPLLTSLGPDPLAALAQPRYLFAPHAARPEHPQYDGGEMTYGETVISLAYVQERWAPLFELVDVSLLSEDLHQVVLTLRRS
jgi:SAM-dependent methyltransferase